MKKVIKSILRENVIIQGRLFENKKLIMRLLKEVLFEEDDLGKKIKTERISDIEDDELYDKLLIQAEELKKDSKIGFNSGDLFGVLLDDNNDLIGATWVELTGKFRFHIAIAENYQGQKLSSNLLDDIIKKYNERKKQLGLNDYEIEADVVNSGLANTLRTYYGFEDVSSNGHGGTIMKYKT